MSVLENHQLNVKFAIPCIFCTAIIPLIYQLNAHIQLNIHTIIYQIFPTSFLPEDGVVCAETCNRDLVNKYLYIYVYATVCVHLVGIFKR